ncbi:hypothetical protein QQP08_022801 [Theobroma cacao]|nr:hypothetical protein QQP08_022801 [Theobroma cacao]
MGTEDGKIHAMFLPYMAPGHMMPMVDAARLLAAAAGTKVTIIVTAMNALRIKNAIDRDVQSGHQISLEILSFPGAQVGLPEGCENMISTPTPEMSMKLFHAIELLQPNIEKLFREYHPDCIISDSLFPWTLDAANDLGIPRIAFNGSGFFNLCVTDSIIRYQPHKNVKSETEAFVVPGLPDEVKLTSSQVPDIYRTRTTFSELFDKLKESERNSFGVLMNSFYELEPAYADHCKKVMGIKTWHIGPVLNFGVAVGNEVWKAWATEESPSITNRDDILKAIDAVMGNTGEATEMRRRAKRLGELAKRAIEEGNSSYNDMKNLIENIRMYKSGTSG